MFGKIVPVHNCAAGGVERAGKLENGGVTGWVRGVRGGCGDGRFSSTYYIWHGTVCFVRRISLWVLAPRFEHAHWSKPTKQPAVIFEKKSHNNFSATKNENLI